MKKKKKSISTKIEKRKQKMCKQRRQSALNTEIVFKAHKTGDTAHALVESI